jgi:hypothetical protein
MVMHRGGSNDYLGMNLDFTEPGVFQVDTIKYIEAVLDNFPEEIHKSSPTPHNEHFFRVQEEAE